MLTIKIHIDEYSRKSIKNIYGKDGYEIVESITKDIIDRYFNAEHFDTELDLQESTDYEICEFCGEKSKHRRMVDTDGTNLKDCSVCDNCGSGYPALG